MLCYEPFFFLFFFFFKSRDLIVFCYLKVQIFYYISTSVYILNHFLLFLFTGYQSDEGCSK